MGELVLDVSGLGISAGSAGSRRPVVHDVGFGLHGGDTLAIVGASGSGKSLTCLALAGLLPGTAQVTGGRALFRGQDLLALDGPSLRRVRGKCMGFVFQDPFTALNPCMPILAQVAEPLTVHGGLGRRQARMRALAMLEEVGIGPLNQCHRRFPHEYSGGQRQRIVIAMALVNQPDLLIADEPTSALDVTVQAQILALLADLQRRHGMAIVLVSHDLEVVAQFADHLLILDQGEVREQGPTASVLASPRSGFTRALIAAMPGAWRRPRRVEPDATVRLALENLSVSHPAPGFLRARSGIPAVNAASLTLRRGEILGLVGESGSGKSTLARALLRLREADSGRILLDGMSWSALGGAALRRERHRVQMVFQDPYASLDPRQTVRQCLVEAVRAGAPGASTDLEQRIDRLLAAVGLTADAADRYPHAFSGGQRQRIAIARAIAPGPEIIVADEPVSALDTVVQEQILLLLARIVQDSRISLLLISHDLRVVRAMADRVAIIEHGSIVESGPTSRVLEEPRHECTRRLLAAMPAALPHGNFDPPSGMRE